MELSIYVEIQNILNSVKAKSLGEALLWSNQNKNKLSKINSNIRFKIIKQQFIEMVKSCFSYFSQDDKDSPSENILPNYGDMKGLLECVKFAKENFSTCELNNEELKEIETLMLLVIINWRNIKQFKDLSFLVSEERWTDLENDIKTAFFNVYSMKPYSSLEILFQCGLMALKTPHCRKTIKSEIKEEDQLSGNNSIENNCPTCNIEIAGLAQSLPYSQHPVSSLLCRKTKKVMDHNNPPLATKNGFLYSTDYINEQLKQNNNKFKCIDENNRIYKLEELKKVFLV